MKAVYVVGKAKSADIVVSDLSLMNEQCEIEFNSSFGWVVKDPNFKKTIFKNKIYLANYSQLKEGRPSNLHYLFGNMAFSFGKYHMRMGVRNINENFIEEDIHESGIDDDNSDSEYANESQTQGLQTTNRSGTFRN